MDILIKSFQTYYKLPEYISTECDEIKWGQTTGSSENLMCKTSTSEKNTRDRLLESNKSFENLLVTLIQFHFQKDTIKNFNNPVEYKDAFNLTFQLANDGQLQNLFDFSIYYKLYKSKSTLIKQTIPNMYLEVIYIVQFLDHIFKNLHSILKSLNKATIKSDILLEPTELINKKTQLEKKHKELSLLITKSIQQSQDDKIISKLVTEQNTLKSQIQELANKISDFTSKEYTNKIDNTLKKGKELMKKFALHIDIITYLLFLNTETIPLELFDKLNKQLKIKNNKFLIFLIDKFTNIIKDNKIAYITPIIINEFKKFKQKQIDDTQVSSPTKQLTTLLTSKTVSPKHKIETLLTNFIKLSEPYAQNILYSIIQQLGLQFTI